MTWISVLTVVLAVAGAGLMALAQTARSRMMTGVLLGAAAAAAALGKALPATGSVTSAANSGRERRGTQGLPPSALPAWSLYAGEAERAQIDSTGQSAEAAVAAAAIVAAVRGVSVCPDTLMFRELWERRTVPDPLEQLTQFLGHSNVAAILVSGPTIPCWGNVDNYLAGGATVCIQWPEGRAHGREGLALVAAMAGDEVTVWCTRRGGWATVPRASLAEGGWLRAVIVQEHRQYDMSAVPLPL